MLKSELIQRIRDLRSKNHDVLWEHFDGSETTQECFVYLVTNLQLVDFTKKRLEKYLSNFENFLKEIGGTL